jgi:UDP-N-acetylglucosamine 2-epimerase (non-hydrolysing)
MEIKEKMNILIAYGTRPEYIKLKPVLLELKGKIDYKLLFTGQHEDMLPELNPDYKLIIKNDGNRLDSIVQSILNCDEFIFEGITHIMVLGDTTTTLAIALLAAHRKIPLIHVEAGARTYNIESPYPEELNRQLISRITSIHLCSADTDKENLMNEKCSGYIHVVGQTGLDNLKNIETNYGNQVLITLHRSENHILIPEYFKVLDELASKYVDLKFILPIHPNPDVYKHKHLLKNVNVIKPVTHDALLEIIASCRFVITDSGGIMDEAVFLGKKVIVPRKIVENQKLQLVNKCIYLCDNPDRMVGIFEKVYKRYENNIKCPFGDGNAASKILKVLKRRDYE